MGQLKRVEFSHNSVQARRENDGWRHGKPLEDPNKTKSWGFVTAKPSEFLIHVRRGQVREKSSGQGASCFKWPRDAVAIIPTSLQRLKFTADQVTREKVGVEVTGLAVFRIANPLLAYRVLNFSYPERAQEKLETTLTDMFIGATRRLIANLTVENCLQQRKEALAHELLREVAPVVGGDGRAADTSSKGWGVVVDTIEIQEVRVLSEHVFSAMQTPFRAELDRKARAAKAEAEREVSTRESECARTIAEAKIASDMAVGAKRHAQQQAEAEAARQQALRATETERELEEARLRAKEQQALAELEVHEVLADAQAKKSDLQRAAWQAEALKRRDEAEIKALEGQTAAAVALAQAKANREQAEARAKVVTAEKLPELAAAMGERIGEVRLTQIGSDGNPFSSLTQAVGAVLELAKQS